MLLMVITGCEPVGGDTKPGDDANQAVVCGEWSLVEWNGEAPVFHVYVKFDNNGAFEIYQQVWDFNYELYKGEYTLSGDVLSGVYEDGKALACEYQVEVKEDKLYMYSKEDDFSVTSVYEKCAIPMEVITEATTTRSDDVVPFL